MTKIKDVKTATAAAEHGTIRTLQALDQAAGGSGDVVLHTAEKAPAQLDIRPQAGTDDARCEDSEAADRRRKKDVADVSSRIDKGRKSQQSRRHGDAKISSKYG